MLEKIWYAIIDFVFGPGVPIFLIAMGIWTTILKADYWEWVNKGGYDKKEEDIDGEDAN